MVVKSKVGRKRYIIFKIYSDSIVSKRDLIYSIHDSIKNASKFLTVPWVISVKNNYGIIQCQHLDKDKTINFLQSMESIGKFKNSVKIITLGTTGTIRSARKKYLDKLILYPSTSNKSKL